MGKEAKTIVINAYAIIADLTSQAIYRVLVENLEILRKNTLDEFLKRRKGGKVHRSKIVKLEEELRRRQDVLAKTR